MAPIHLVDRRAPTSIQRNSAEIESYLEHLLLDLRAGQVYGLALVVERADGRVTTYFDQTASRYANRFRIAGAIGSLLHRINNELQKEE